MKCSKCNRPSKGHNKPLGDDCTMPEMSDLEKDALQIIETQELREQGLDPDHSSESQKKLEAAGGNDGDFGTAIEAFTIKELTAQMAALNNTVLSLAHNQEAMRRDIQLQAPASTPAPMMAPPPGTQASSAYPPSPHPPPSTSGLLAFTGTQTSPASAGIPGQRPMLPHLMHGNPSAENKAKALRGEYIVLEDFGPNELLPPSNTMEPYTDSQGALALRPKRPKKILDTFDKWLAAWTNYELLLVNNGHSYSQIAHHKATIQHVNRRYIWSVIYAYDIKYRLSRAEHNSTDFSADASELYNSFFDASALKTDYPRCRRCKSTEHLVADCPFPAEEKMGAKAPQNGFKKEPYERWYHNGQEGCNMWNIGKCRMSPCRRAHVCRGCRGYQPQLSCTTCKGFPSQTQSGSLQGGTGAARQF